MDALDVKTLTILHVIRVPVELILLSLFLHKAIPQLMTFEGRNFDILSGITAPFVYYFGFVGKRPKAKIVLAWNFICLALLINIVINAILAAPSPFQKFAFEQPNEPILAVGFLINAGNFLPKLIAHLFCGLQVKRGQNAAINRDQMRRELHRYFRAGREGCFLFEFGKAFPKL